MGISIKVCRLFSALFVVFTLLLAQVSLAKKVAEDPDSSQTSVDSEAVVEARESSSGFLGWFFQGFRWFNKDEVITDSDPTRPNPIESYRLYKSLSADELLEAIKAGFDIRQKRESVDFSFGRERIEPGTLFYAPISRGLPGQLGISASDYLARYKKIVKGIGYKYDSKSQLWLPAYDDGQAILAPHEAATGYLVRDEKTGKEYVLLDDGNHRFAASLLDPMTTTFPITIKEDLRWDYTLCAAYQKLIAEGKLYFAEKGGKLHDFVTKCGEHEIGFPPTIHVLENDVIRHVVSELTAKFVVEMDDKGDRARRVEAKSFNGPVVLIKVKVLKQKRKATVPFMEFKVSNLIYFALSGKSVILTDKLGGRSQLAAWKKTLLSLGSGKDFLEAQQIVSKILHAIWSSNPEDIQLSNYLRSLPRKIWAFTLCPL